MSTEFYVGDLVIMQNATVFDECDGFPAVVIQAGMVRRCMNMVSMEHENVYCYKVKILKEPDELSLNRLEYCATPRQLRKLHDSEGEMVVDSVSSLALTE